LISSPGMGIYGSHSDQREICDRDCVPFIPTKRKLFFDDNDIFRGQKVVKPPRCTKKEGVASAGSVFLEILESIEIYGAR